MAPPPPKLRRNLAEAMRAKVGAHMANRSRPSQQKRHKERARQEKQKMKAERRQEAKIRRANSPGMPAGEDPDIAGIVPGPQPPREDQLFDVDEEN